MAKRARLEAEDFHYAVRELRLFAENTGELYPRVRELVGHLARRHPEQAVQECLSGWLALCTDAAKLYRKEIQDAPDFNLEVVDRVARDWASDYLSRLLLGEEGLYD